MKAIITLMILSFALSAKSQNLAYLKQHWFTRSLHEFYVGKIIDTVVKLPKVYETTCYQLKDTVYVHKSYSRTFGGGKGDTVIDTHKYNIVYLSRDTLIMKVPKGYWEPKDRLDTFYSERSLVEKDIRFCKLQLTINTNPYFSKTGKAFDVVVDSTGSIIYNGRINTVPYKGTYKGRLTKKQMTAVMDILKSMSLKNQPTERACGLDEEPQKLIVYADNQRYFTYGCDGNYLLDKLFDFFWNYNTDKSSRLVKYSKKIELE